MARQPAELGTHHPAAATTAERDVEAAVDHALDQLRASGARITTSRRLLLRCLYTAGSHRTAEELAADVQALAPDVHLSTIYRNLDELERLGLVHHAHLGHGPANYHLPDEAHSHLVCEECGTTFEAPVGFFQALATAARTRYGFTIDPRHFAVLGRCAACATAPDPATPDGPPHPRGASLSPGDLLVPASEQPEHALAAHPEPLGDLGGARPLLDQGGGEHSP